MEDRIVSTEVSDKFEMTQTSHIFALAEQEKNFVSKTYKIGDEKITVFKDSRGRFSMVLGDKVPPLAEDENFVRQVVELAEQTQASISVSAEEAKSEIRS